MNAVKNITNKKFNRLKVIGIAGINSNREVLWECICDCGNKVVKTGSHIRNSYVKSCGCIRKDLKPALGMRHTEQTKRKMADRVKKEWASGLRKPTRTGKKLSYAQKLLLSELKRGENNPAWVDGRSKLTSQVRKCLKNREWRTSIFERDNYTCVLCSKRGGYLEVDHYPTEFAKIWSEEKINSLEQALACGRFWDIENGRTLCKECHATKTYANNRHK